MLFKVNNILAYSDPKTWDNKRIKATEFSMNLIMNREKFVPYCYPDGIEKKTKKQKYSLGYGTAHTIIGKNWCEIHIEVLKKQNITLRYLSDDIVRKFVKVNEPQARWKIKEFVIVIYDNLEKKNINLIQKLDEIELAAIISLIYTIGETNFYKSTLYQIISNTIIYDTKICIRIKNNFLNFSKVRTKNGLIFSIGAKNRREVEMLMFTYRKCVF